MMVLFISALHFFGVFMYWIDFGVSAVQGRTFV